MLDIANLFFAETICIGIVVLNTWAFKLACNI